MTEIAGFVLKAVSPETFMTGFHTAFVKSGGWFFAIKHSVSVHTYAAVFSDITVALYGRAAMLRQEDLCENVAKIVRQRTDLVLDAAYYQH